MGNYRIDQFKTGLHNPKKVLRIFKSNRFKFDEEKFLPLYNSVRQFNQKNSKKPIFFDFCKRILMDSISDKSLRNRFFKDPNQISDSEMKTAMKDKVDIKTLAGLSWPKRSYTMIGLTRLENLQFCVEDVIKNNIEGDLIEAGVWRGGACIFMRLLLKNYGIENKIVYAADSFEGLPKPDPNYPADANDKHYSFYVMKVSLEEVKNNFRLYDVLDDKVKFLKGWFKDTLKQPPFEKLCILRSDGDMYGSTMNILENLYNKVSVGGYVIMDDFNLKNGRAAIIDFRSQNNITDPIKEIDGNGIFWKKSS